MPFHPRAIQRVAVGILAVAGLLLGLWGLGAQVMQWQADPTAWPDLSALLTDTGRQLAIPAFAFLALLIVWLTPYQSGALFGVLFLSVYALWGAAAEHLDRGGPWFVPAIMALDFLFHTSAVRFSQLFPRPLQRSEVMALGRGRLTKPLASLFAFGLDPRVFWPVAVVGEGLVLGLPWGWLYMAHVMFVSLLAAGYFYAGYRRGSEAERQRIFWLMEAAVVFAATELIFYALNALYALQIFDINREFWASWLHLAMVWATLLCFVLAIFYKGAFDSRLVLRRTTVASAAGALAVVIFITMETAVTETLEGVFGFESRAGTIAGGVAVALLLRPITDRIDRRLGGKGKSEESATADSA
jgi:hypothetical protein